MCVGIGLSFFVLSVGVNIAFPPFLTSCHSVSPVGRSIWYGFSHFLYALKSVPVIQFLKISSSPCFCPCTSTSSCLQSSITWALGRISVGIFCGIGLFATFIPFCCATLAQRRETWFCMAHFPSISRSSGMLNTEVLSVRTIRISIGALGLFDGTI